MYTDQQISDEAKACAHLSVIKGTMKEQAVEEAFKSGYYLCKNSQPSPSAGVSAESLWLEHSCIIIGELDSEEAAAQWMRVPLMTKESFIAALKEYDQFRLKVIRAESEDTWEFWKEIIFNSDGTVNMEQVRKELADFSFILEQVPKVYCHVTSDMLSKPNYYADVINNAADDAYRLLYQEAAKEMIDDLLKGGEITAKARKTIADNIERYL